MNTCPVCGYSKMEFPATRFDTICACCGTQFGYDDCTRSHASLRKDWIKRGCLYFDFRVEPKDWSRHAAFKQMRQANLLPSLMEGIADMSAEVVVMRQVNRSALLEPTGAFYSLGDGLTDRSFAVQAIRSRTATVSRAEMVFPKRSATG